MKSAKSILHLLLFLLSAKSFAVVKGDLVTNLDVLNSTVKIYGEAGTCTGIIIGKRTILTAAHCIDTKGDDGRTIMRPIAVQKFNSADKPGVLIGVSLSVSTNSDEAGKDVGYIYLSKDLDLQIAPINLATSFSENDELCVAGQGQDENGSTGNLKMYCGLKVLADNAFGLFFVGNANDTLAGFGPGDSGGPIYKKLSSGKYEIVGVVSRGSFGSNKKSIFIREGVSTNLMTDITTGFAAHWISLYKCINFGTSDPELCRP